MEKANRDNHNGGSIQEKPATFAFGLYMTEPDIDIRQRACDELNLTLNEPVFVLSIGSFRVDGSRLSQGNYRVWLEGLTDEQQQQFSDRVVELAEELSH